MEKPPKVSYKYNYVSAPANTYVTIIYCYMPDDREPTMEDLEIGRSPVVAWEIESMFHDDEDQPSFTVASPVLADFKDDSAAYLIEGPGTILTAPEDAVYADLEEAKKGVLQARQMYWGVMQKNKERKKAKEKKNG